MKGLAAVDFEGRDQTAWFSPWFPMSLVFWTLSSSLLQPYSSSFWNPFKGRKIKIPSEQSVSDFAAGVNVGVKYTHF